MNSTFKTINKTDLLEGLITAGLGGAFTTLTTAIAIISDFANFNPITLLYAFVVGFLGGFSGYVQKTFFSNSDGQVFKKEN